MKEPIVPSLTQDDAKQSTITANRYISSEQQQKRHSRLKETVKELRAHGGWSFSFDPEMDPTAESVLDNPRTMQFAYTLLRKELTLRLYWNVKERVPHATIESPVSRKPKLIVSPYIKGDWPKKWARSIHAQARQYYLPGGECSSLTHAIKYLQEESQRR